jgi:hypothetical protein
MNPIEAFQFTLLTCRLGFFAFWAAYWYFS